jgi:hypothetical protein
VAYWGWQKFRTPILALPEYRVTAQQVEITPLPEWIHSDVREEVFRDPALAGPLSIMDDDLVERIAKAFVRHPWVAKVHLVTKRHPAAVKVELVYRKPVCMVVVPSGLVPVDKEGILLPGGVGNFSPIEATRYPRLEDVDHMPTGMVGSRWTDAKVIGGAEIAAAIGPAWDALGLRSIVPLAADPAMAAGNAGSPAGISGRQAAEPFFVLMTRGGTRILWGYAPGAGVIGELSAPEKVARLQRYLADHDMLDGRQGERQELDVRKLPAK